MIGALMPQLCALIRDGYDTTIKDEDGLDALALLIATAASKRKTDWVYSLFEALLDRSGNANTRSVDQMTPLIQWNVASEGNDSATPYLMLLNRAADIDAQDGSGNTVIHWLVAGAEIAVLKELADAGWLTAANLTLLNNAGETALETARRELRVDDDRVDVVKRRVICDLLREQATLRTEEARPLIHLLLSHSLRIPDLAHMVLSFVDGKERGQ
jgi:ankyrin repeat protein